MTVTVSNIIPAKVAEVTQVTQYTSTSVKTIIDKFTVTNTTAGGLDISVNIVASGDAAAVANLIVDAQTVAANSTELFPQLVGHTMIAGDFISTIATAGAGLTMRASGRVVT